MIAAAFAYFNYKFSEYKFIDFNEWTFYTKKDVFIPDAQKYVIVFYSSKQQNTQKYLSDLDLNLPILAIDYYNEIYEDSQNVTFLRSGTNTSLSFIQRFNIYESPSIFIIKKSKDTLYKQDSMIRKLDNLEMLSKQIESL